MNIQATGGDKTAINDTGTQGSISDSVQGVKNPGGDNVTQSVKAAPQVIAPNKMTK